MQIGRVSYGYGTSRLWHDPDYTIERPLYPHQVTRGLEQELPAQQHIAPPAPSDPYLAQEKSYDLAFQQMERGLEGRDFLHGVKSEGAFDKAAHAKAMDKTTVDATAPAAAVSADAASRSVSSSQMVHGVEDHIDIADEAIYQSQAVLTSQRSGRIESPEEAAVARAIEINRREGLPPPGQVQTSQGTRTSGYEESRQAAEHAREHNRITEAISMVQGTISAAATAAVSAQAAQAAVGTAAQNAVALEAVVASGASAVGQANQAGEAADLDQALRKRREPSYEKAFKSLNPSIGKTEVDAEQRVVAAEQINGSVGSASAAQGLDVREATEPEQAGGLPGGGFGTDEQ